MCNVCFPRKLKIAEINFRRQERKEGDMPPVRAIGDAGDVEEQRDDTSEQHDAIDVPVATLQVLPGRSGHHSDHGGEEHLRHQRQERHGGAGYGAERQRVGPEAEWELLHGRVHPGTDLSAEGTAGQSVTAAGACARPKGIPITLNIR